MADLKYKVRFFVFLKKLSIHLSKRIVSDILLLGFGRLLEYRPSTVNNNSMQFKNMLRQLIPPPRYHVTIPTVQNTTRGVNGSVAQTSAKVIVGRTKEVTIKSLSGHPHPTHHR